MEDDRVDAHSATYGVEEFVCQMHKVLLSVANRNSIQKLSKNNK
jgi:hypothetical protein